jgi:hypothetical protein
MDDEGETYWLRMDGRFGGLEGEGVLSKLLEGGRQSEIAFRLLSCFRLYLLGSDELFSLSPPFLPLDDRLA